MGKKCCEVQQGYHVHPYCIYTDEKDCHRHLMRGYTAPAPNTPCHKHEYSGETSYNDCHAHKYCGKTDKPIEAVCGHVHKICGKTECAADHKHRYDGTTGLQKIIWR